MLLPEALAAPAATDLGAAAGPARKGLVAVAAPAAAGADGTCFARPLLLLEVLTAASTPRCGAERLVWSLWRALGWLYCTTALPSSLTCSLCLPSSLNTIKRDTAPAVLGCQVIGSSTLLCGAIALLQLRLAAAGKLGSADMLKPSCTGNLSTPSC